MSTKREPTLRVNFRTCTGCRACTIACALSHEQQVELHRARIRVQKRIPEMKTPVFKPVFCRQCRNAQCVSVCPTGALVQDEESGQVILYTELCNGCGECLEACPFDAIWMDDERGVVFKCDLCGGDPVCVKFCAPEALSYG